MTASYRSSTIRSLTLSANVDRLDLQKQRLRKPRQVVLHKECSRCGRKLTFAQFKAQAGSPLRSSGFLQRKAGTQKSVPKRRLIAGTPEAPVGNAEKQQIKQNHSPDAGTQQGDSSNPAGAAERQQKQEDPPGTAIQQTMPSYPLHAAKSQAKASSPAHKARGKLTSAGFVQSTKSAALQPGKGRQGFSAPKILKAPVQDASPDKEENAKAEESGSEDDDDLWEEVGEEVPWQDSEPVVKTKGKAVPPGEYFTVVKGPKKRSDSAQPASPAPSSPNSMQPTSGIHSSSSTSSMLQTNHNGQPSIAAQQIGSSTNSSSTNSSSTSSDTTSKSTVSSSLLAQSVSSAASSQSCAANSKAHGSDATYSSSSDATYSSSSSASAGMPLLPQAMDFHSAAFTLAKGRQADIAQHAGTRNSETLDRQPTPALSTSQAADASQQSVSDTRVSKAERLKKLVLAGSRGSSKAGSEKPGDVTQELGAQVADNMGAAKKGHQFFLPKGSPSPLRLTTNFEAQGEQAGYFLELLIQGGFLTADLDRVMDVPMEAVGLQVNQCIVRSETAQGVLNIVRDLLPVFDRVNIATSMHRLAKLVKDNKVSNQLVLHHVCYPLLIAKAVDMATTLEPRQVGNIIWAIATLKDRKSELISHIDMQILELDLHTFSPQELSNVVWAYGTLKYRQNEELMRRASVEVLERGLDEFVPQGVANMCWAFAKNDLIYEDFLEATGFHVAEKVHLYHSQAIANIVWAYAKMGYCHDALMAAVAQAFTGTVPATMDRPAHPRLQDFKCQEISNVMYAFAGLGSYNADVLQAVEQEMSKPERIRDATKQGIVNIMWSFATLRFYPPKFMEAACTGLEQHMHTLNDQELSNCLWSFGRLAHHPGKLMNSFFKCLDREMESGRAFSLQACANSLWALGVLQAANNATAMRIIHLISQYDYTELIATQLHQLFQALLLARIEASMAGDRQLANNLVLPKKLQEEAVRCWKVMMRSSRVSMLHQDVSDVIAAMQIQHQMEYLAEDGIFSVDIALLGSEKKVAIEVDGPYHYTLNTHQPLGHTILRRRLLTALGWTVVSVPYFDWNRLHTGPRKANYLAKLLAQHGFMAPSKGIPNHDSLVHTAKKDAEDPGAIASHSALPLEQVQEPAAATLSSTEQQLAISSLQGPGSNSQATITDAARRAAEAAQAFNRRKPGRLQPQRSQISLSKVQAFRQSNTANSIAQVPHRSDATYRPAYKAVSSESEPVVATAAELPSPRVMLTESQQESGSDGAVAAAAAVLPSPAAVPTELQQASGSYGAPAAAAADMRPLTNELWQHSEQAEQPQCLHQEPAYSEQHVTEKHVNSGHSEQAQALQQEPAYPAGRDGNFYNEGNADNCLNAGKAESALSTGHTGWLLHDNKAGLELSTGSGKQPTNEGNAEQSVTDGNVQVVKTEDLAQSASSGHGCEHSLHDANAISTDDASSSEHHAEPAAAHATRAASDKAFAARQGQLKQLRLVAELRPLCKQYGLPVAGVKQDVVSRILEYELHQIHNEGPSFTTVTDKLPAHDQ